MKYFKDSRQSIERIKKSLADKDIDMFEFAKQIGSLNRTFMTNRDNLTSGETIFDAGQLTVTYNIVITYP